LTLPAILGAALDRDIDLVVQAAFVQKHFSLQALPCL